MNAILSKNVLEQVIALAMPPGNVGKKPDGGPWYFTPVPAKCWSYPEPHPHLVHVPELVSAFGERAFAAHWC